MIGIMKKIMNRAEDIVEEMIKGMAFAHPQLNCFPEDRVVARRQKETKVGLVSGGGSGHEPAHAGFVGYGMLDAAVAGNIFASPSPEQMLKGIAEANSGMGVLFILKNYTGDLMNFSMAKDMAEMDGIVVDSVVVKDDVAVPDSTYSAGRRGIAGTVLVHKVTGAMAQKGETLEEVKRVAEKAISRVRTMGMSMSACILPGLDKPGFVVEKGKVEIGMGIHGEPGMGQASAMTSAKLSKILLENLLNDYDFGGKKVAVMVNGMGATTLIELYTLASDLEKELRRNNIISHRVFVGNYMTSLEMSGCSLSLLDLDDELTELIDATCDTPGMKIIS
jgi:dihydroxyacetone kinase, DhaK subunit